MDIFETIVTSFASVPAWVSLLLIPGGFLTYVVFTVVLGGRRSYPFVSCACCAIEAILASAHGGAAAVFTCGAFALYALILRLLFLLPGRDREKWTEARSARILKKLEGERPAETAISKPPAKVCAYEEPPMKLTVAERGMRLAHAEELLARLRRAQLTPSDRLEADILSRTLSGYEVRPISEEEMMLLNDSLASLLKLSAKYKL